MRNSMAGGPGYSVEAHVTKARSHTIGDLLRRTALRYPDKTALVAGDFRETYAQLNATVNATAHALSDRGVVKGDRIALLSHNCREFVVVYLALAKLGAILVPVNFMLTAEEIAFILDHCEVSGLVTEDALAPIAERALAVAGRGVDIAGLDQLGCSRARCSGAGHSRPLGGRRVLAGACRHIRTRCGHR